MLKLELGFLREVKARIIREFIDVIILNRLRDVPSSGYDLIQYIHRKSDMLISPGTVYSRLYLMERKGLAEGRMMGKKRIYQITSKGLVYIETLYNNSETILRFIGELFRGL